MKYNCQRFSIENNSTELAVGGLLIILKIHHHLAFFLLRKAKAILAVGEWDRDIETVKSTYFNLVNGYIFITLCMPFNVCINKEFSS